MYLKHFVKFFFFQFQIGDFKDKSLEHVVSNISRQLYIESVILNMFFCFFLINLVPIFAWCMMDYDGFLSLNVDEAVFVGFLEFLKKKLQFLFCL